MYRIAIACIAVLTTYNVVHATPSPCWLKDPKKESYKILSHENIQTYTWENIQFICDQLSKDDEGKDDEGKYLSLAIKNKMQRQRQDNWKVKTGTFLGCGVILPPALIACGLNYPSTTCAAMTGIAGYTIYHRFSQTHPANEERENNDYLRIADNMLQSPGSYTQGFQRECINHFNKPDEPWKNAVSWALQERLDLRRARGKLGRYGALGFVVGSAGWIGASPIIYLSALESKK